MSAIVEVETLSKRYGRGARTVHALSELTLTIPAGGVFGLLGPNGAGKSTLLRILTGLVRPTSGSARLFDAPLGPAGLARIGAFVEAPRFYPYLTAAETLEMVARTSKVPHADNTPLLDRVGLAGAADRRVDDFSLGMKQRLAIAAALVGTPELVILDEPTNGMDPGGIQEIRHLVRELADRDGITILLSSHLLDEVERCCDRVAILNRGRLAAEGRIDELLGGSERLRIEASPVDIVLERLGPAAERDGEAVLAKVDRAQTPALIAAIVADGAEVFEARWIRRDLEAVFFKETEKA